jgi:hypothetical protein
MAARLFSISPAILDELDPEPKLSLPGLAFA